MKGGVLLDRTTCSRDLPNGMVKYFLFSAGIIFGITGLVKIVSSFGTAKALEMRDPILQISFRHLMVATGLTEAAIAYVCLFTMRKKLGLILVWCMTMNLVIYRLGLWMVSWHGICHCMGNLTAVIDISPVTAESLAKMALAYLIAGCFFSAFVNSGPYFVTPNRTIQSKL